MKRYLSVLVIILLLGSTSCYSPRYVYSPVAHNVPLIKKKGDSKLAAFYSTNLGERNRITTYGKINKGNGLDVQGGYALTDHFALQAAYTRRWERNYADFNVNSYDTSIITYSRKSVEFGAGYYTYLSRRRQSVFQLFAGTSVGSSSFTDQYFSGNLPERTFSMHVTKLYLQPAFMLWYEDVFATTLSSRVSIVYFRNINTNYTAEELHSYQLADLDTNTEVFWEPAFINSFGLRKVPGLKLELQFGMSFLMSQHFVDYRSLNFSAGAVLDLPKFFKKNSSAAKN